MTTTNNPIPEQAPESTSTGIIVGILIAILIILIVLVFGLPYLRGRGTGTPAPENNSKTLQGTLNTTL